MFACDTHRRAVHSATTQIDQQWCWWFDECERTYLKREELLQVSWTGQIHMMNDAREKVTPHFDRPREQRD